jgi:hypothetical protein
LKDPEFTAHGLLKGSPRTKPKEPQLGVTFRKDELLFLFHLLEGRDSETQGSQVHLVP